MSAAATRVYPVLLGRVLATAATINSRSVERLARGWYLPVLGELTAHPGTAKAGRERRDERRLEEQFRHPTIARDVHGAAWESLLH